MQGKFIAFEGIDSIGKTTTATKIRNWLAEELDITVHLTHHPGSTPVGKNLRELLKHSKDPINSNAQALLFAADNSLFMNQILDPALEKGEWVLGDRNNFISSIAYQIASGCSWDELDKVHAATRQTNKIDLLLVFRCPLNELKKRQKKSSKPDRYEDAGEAYHQKLLNCYNHLIQEQPDRLSKFVKFLDGKINAHYVDASQPLNKVVDDVKNLITGRLL